MVKIVFLEHHGTFHYIILRVLIKKKIFTMKYVMIRIF
jgi:hypothetical protein